MAFYFSESNVDKLSSKINLRQLSLKSKQWDHPMKGVLKYVESMKINNRDILNLPKKVREQYCISLTTLAMIKDSKRDWWVGTYAEEPPDGVVMTMTQDTQQKYYVNLREVEVVEHRGNKNELFNTLKDKLTLKQYEANTVLVCLLLTQDIYDLKELSTKLKEVKTTISHVFVVFSGILLDNLEKSDRELKSTFTTVQLLPIFENITFDIKDFMDDFNDRYEKGQESRIIDGNQVYFATSNKKFTN